MGSLVAFEVARLLRRRGYSPERLIAAALRPPHIPHRGRRLHILPHDEFADAIRLLKGTPDAVLQNRELMSLVLPAIHSDFRAYETYSYADEPPLDCAISAMGGVSDASVTREELDQWRQHTTAGFTIRTFPGGHFFMHEARPQLLGAQRHDLCRPACAAA
jgi:medium-chain acyl-[acyl-carrier-protein] hydrolase